MTSQVHGYIKAGIALVLAILAALVSALHRVTDFGDIDTQTWLIALGAVLASGALVAFVENVAGTGRRDHQGRHRRLRCGDRVARPRARRPGAESGGEDHGAQCVRRRTRARVPDPRPEPEPAPARRANHATPRFAGRTEFGGLRRCGLPFTRACLLPWAAPFAPPSHFTRGRGFLRSLTSEVSVLPYGT